MNKTSFASIIIAIMLLIFMSCTFIVKEGETAIKTKLGEIIETDYKPGIYFYIPGYHQIIPFDARIQTSDQEPKRFLTKEKKDVIVDFYVKWKILDVKNYYTSTSGNIDTAANLLSERVGSALRAEFGKRTIQEVISGDRQKIMDLLTEESTKQAIELGIKIVDVRVKKIDLPRRVSESVYERMRTERERVARDLRAKGHEAAEKIKAKADRERIEILAQSNKQSEILRGQGEALAASTYANAFNQDKAFYAQWRSFSAYKKVFEGNGNVMLIKPDSEFFRYFKQAKVQ